MRLTGFAFLPMLGLVVPFLFMPVVGAVVGSGGWSSAIAGQSIGTIAAVIIQWGWNIDGTVLVAKSESAAERASLYGRSVRTRLLLCLMIIPLGSVVSALVAQPGYASGAVGMTVAYSLIGLSPAWYCIGSGSPKHLALFDTIPRVVAVLAATPLLLVARAVWPYPVMVIITTAVSLWMFQRRFAPGEKVLPFPLSETVKDLLSQRNTVGINLAGQVYAQTPAPIATATSSAASSGALATTDALYRFGLLGAVALGNAFQGWVLEPGATNRKRRHLAAIVAHSILGVVGIFVLVLVGPPLSPIISGSASVATPELCLYYGLAFAFLSMSTPLIRNLMIPAGKQAHVLRVTLLAALAGIVFMLGSAFMGYVDGIAIGMATSEFVMLLLLIPQSVKILNEGRERV